MNRFLCSRLVILIGLMLTSGYAWSQTPEFFQSAPLTILHSFPAPVSIGANPNARLTQGSDGNFYGVTYAGGASNVGTVFKLTSSGLLTSLHAFDTADGAVPSSPLTQGSDGSFFGTTSSGGANGTGTVYKITPSGAFTKLADFAALSNGDNATGAYPNGNLVVGGDGNFYGTASSGGPNGTGTIFKTTPLGSLTTLYAFSALNSSQENADGAQPTSLILGSDDNFYGITVNGGANGNGTVFKITPAGTLTTIYAFSAVNYSGFNADGAGPYALIQGSDGNLYGTTMFGGANGFGIIFKLTTTGTLTALHSFSNPGLQGVSAERATLYQGSDGNLYGTTYYDGANGTSTIFKITPAGAYSTIYHLSPLTVVSPVTDYVNAEGEYPNALIQGSDGSFYGTTSTGGPYGVGTVFKITPAGSLTVLYSFSFGISSDGVYPSAVRTGTDGNFYGTAFGGGAYGYGVVYLATPDGVVTILHSFAGADGIAPNTPLTQGSDGSFYGTTDFGGANDWGTIFKITPAGALTVLHSFAAPSGSITGGPYINADGVFANALFVAGDGTVYGTTQQGGTNGSGVVFRLTPSGTYTLLHVFSALGTDSINNDGAQPRAGLV